MPLGGVNGPPLDVVPDVDRKVAHEETPERALVVGAGFLVSVGLALSFAAHVVLLAPVVYFAGANPFDPVPADAIMVDIVSPEEAREAPKQEAAAIDAIPSFDGKARELVPQIGQALRSANAPSPAAAATPAEPPRPQPSSPARALQQGAARQDARQAPPASPAPLPAWLPQQFAPAEPEPPPPPQETDITNMFAMPLTLPDGTVGGKYDSQAVDRVDVSNDSVAAFRTHLKTCSALPAGVAPEVRVVLRVYLKPDGSLASGLPQNPEPIKVEGVSVGGGALFQRAVAALRKCQPFKMLPPDKYEEWKSLDLTFTPQNF